MKPLARNVLNLPLATRMVDVLRREFATATAADLSVSFVRSSGLQLVLPELKAFLWRGGALRVLTSTYLSITDPPSLRTLHALAPTRVRVQHGEHGFHGKTYLFRSPDSQRLYVGSSNWTKGGIADNLEWNTLHEDPAVLSEAHALFEQLWARPDVEMVDEAFIARYDAAYRRLYANAQAANAHNDTDSAQDGDEARDSNGQRVPSDTPPEPRGDQLEALARLDQLREGGARRAVVIAATGVGKTLLAAFHAHRRDARSVLFLAHRKEILLQAQRAFRRVFGSSISCALLVEGERYRGEPFVFATVQALARMDPTSALFHRTHDLVVVDEFHHADAPSYRRLIDALRFEFLLGLTATPERADGHNVLEICDYNVAYELRLHEAIRRRLLRPFHYFGVADELVEYTRIPWRNGGFDPHELENALLVEDRVDQLIAQAIEKGFDGPKRVAIGFCAGVRHATFMCEAFARRGVKAAVVTGADDLDARDKIYARLQDPRDPLEWLFVSDVLNEGVDLPAINTVAFLRPTTSTGVFLQQLGRGLRLTEGSEVLTVLDFVGHHRAAFSPLEALRDPTAPADERERKAYEFRPPPRCEFVLDDRTREILDKLRLVRRSKKDHCREAYESLRAELQRPPTPIDTWGLSPDFREYRRAFGTWLELRKATGDAEPWERALSADSDAVTLLSKAESDWQEQRVLAYAALWAAMESPSDLEAGYARFFEVYPHWSVERVVADRAELEARLQRNLEPLFRDGAWGGALRSALDDVRLRQAIQQRIAFTLAADFKTRHGGVLRTPDALRLHVAYSRPEIVNHFGVQFDPARHNMGVLRFEPGHIVLILKLDTSSAKTEHQYTNRIVDERHLLWTSQNRMRRDNEAGRSITEHAARGETLHAFVQPSSHEPAVYLGAVTVVDAEGDAPMRVMLRCAQVLTDGVRTALGH